MRPATVSRVTVTGGSAPPRPSLPPPGSPRRRPFPARHPPPRPPRGWRGTRGARRTPAPRPRCACVVWCSGGKIRVSALGKRAEIDKRVGDVGTPLGGARWRRGKSRAVECIHADAEDAPRAAVRRRTLCPPERARGVSCAWRTSRGSPDRRLDARAKWPLTRAVGGDVAAVVTFREKGMEISSERHREMTLPRPAARRGSFGDARVSPVRARRRCVAARRCRAARPPRSG